MGLFKNLMGEGFTEQQIEYALRDHWNVTIAKTNSRSVLGSMNDLAFHLKCSIETMGGMDRADLSEVGRRLNRIPMSAIKYHCSIDELKRRLADAH